MELLTVEHAVLEHRYRDRLTGYQGVASARAVYASGEVKILLERVKADGSIEERWVAEPRLELVPDGTPGQYA